MGQQSRGGAAIPIADNKIIQLSINFHSSCTDSVGPGGHNPHSTVYRVSLVSGPSGSINKVVLYQEDKTTLRMTWQRKCV